MRPGRVLRELEAFPLAFVARVAGIAKPHPAANQIDPAVAIHVESGETDIGLVARANLVPHPFVGALRFIPIQPLRTWLTPPDHEIEMTVAVDIHQCREAIVALEAVVLGKCQVDEVVPETNFPGHSSDCKHQRKTGKHPRNVKKTHHGRDRGF